jgi:acetone carboxylase gamma subunit
MASSRPRCGKCKTDLRVRRETDTLHALFNDGLIRDAEADQLPVHREFIECPKCGTLSQIDTRQNSQAELVSMIESLRTQGKIAPLVAAKKKK